MGKEKKYFKNPNVNSQPKFSKVKKINSDLDRISIEILPLKLAVVLQKNAGQISNGHMSDAKHFSFAYFQNM